MNIKNHSDADLWLLYSKTKSIDVRNELVVRYSGLVKYIATRTIANFKYFNYLDDIINEGIVALMSSVEKFDATKNVKFETYASIKVKGAIIDYIRKQDCFPRRIKKLAKTISDAENELVLKLGRNPNQDEIANYLGVGIQEFAKMQLEVHNLNVLSFEQILYENVSDENVLESLENSSIKTPEQSLAEEELQQVLAQNIDMLNEKEKLVIAMYYKEQIKIKDIANILNISDSRVSQIHSQALKKLRCSLEVYMTV